MSHNLRALPDFKASLAEIIIFFVYLSSAETYLVNKVCFFDVALVH